MEITITSGGSSGNASALIGRAGSVALSSGVTSASFSYVNPFSSANYRLNYSVKNIVDATPVFLNPITTAKDANGFTVTFNAATDTANYIFEFIASGDIA